MKKLIIVLIVLLFISNKGIGQSFPFLGYHFKNLNFECAGFVTAVYPAGKWANLQNQVLYAKTDIGGVYKSTNNGLNWISISSYFEGDNESNMHLYYSEYIIAGLAVNPKDSNNVVIAWGSLKTDAEAAGYQCLWMTSNGGSTWHKSIFQNCTGPWFDGDNLMRKVGGECIAFDPHNSGRVYVGGNPSSNNDKPKLYVSNDSGRSFTVLSSFDAYNNGESILCMSFQKDVQSNNRIWIGTTEGVYVSDYNGYPNFFVFQTNLYGKGIRKIIRILPRKNGDAFVAFGDYSFTPTSGIIGGLMKYNQSSSEWEECSFEFGFPPYSTIDKNYLSMLTFADNDENVLLAGRVNQPVRKSTASGTNFGHDWVGENGNQQIELGYNQSSDYPNHQLLYEVQGAKRMFSGLNFLIKNPNHPTCWYISGGAGLRITTNASTNYGANFLSGEIWGYKTAGQSMPVVFDISFEPNNSRANPGMLIPIGDWTMAYKNNQIADFEKLDYDNRNIIPGVNTGNAWISEVSRALYKPLQSNVTYVMGGDSYSGANRARLYKRTREISGNIIIDSVSLFQDSNRFICDGTIFKWNSDYDNLLILVGSDQETTPDPTQKLGLFRSTDDGETFIPTSFTLQNSCLPEVNTYERYMNSILPVGYSGKIQGRWESQFNLARVPTPNNGEDIIYLYLENGGVFFSINGGADWTVATNQPVSNGLGKGCLKYIGNNQLALAIEGKGLYKGTINVSTGDVINWEAFGGFTSASQVDVYNGKWVVFGKRDGVNNNRLIKYTSWPTPDWRLITGRIRGVRSLRIRPNNTNEVWIATTGMGVVVYNHLYSNNFLISKEASVCDNVNINTNTTFDEDVVVENGGQLILQDSAVIQLAEGVKIIVQEGGKLQANKVTFISKSENENWGGIEVENCDSSLTIQNCTFNNATLPIKIINNGTHAYNEKIIKNNVFNCQNSSDFAIYAENVFNILIQGNQFNMSGESSATVGLEIINNGDYISTETETKTNIVNNTFTNGCASMVLNSYASELTPVYVYGNTFNGSSANYNIIGRMITGKIKNNNFSGTGTDNPVYLQQCTPDMFGNVINGTGTTMILNGHSYPNLSPLRLSNTNYWYGGQNKLSSSDAGNINIINAGIPLINYGHNQFSKNSDPLYFHISGALDSTVETYGAAENAWCSSGENPVNYLYTSGNPYVITDFSNNYTCNQLPAVQYTGSVITNMGFGINDTLFTSPYSTNTYIFPDEILYSQASGYTSNGQSLDAINSYKNLINTYLESQYLNTSLYDIFDCYQVLDTSSNNTYRDNLYSDLRIFLNDKIQSGNYNSEFIDIAFYLENMCKVNMENYNDALTGFEFIAMFHPDAEMRLLASWDYDEVQDLMGQSGAQKEVTAKQFRKKVFSEIENAMKNDSTMRVVSRMFKQQNEEIDNTYSNKTTTSKFYNENTGKIKTDNASKKDNTSKENSKRPKIMQLSKEVREDLMQRAEDNLRGLRSMNTESKIKKHKEDILLIAGLTAATEKKIETTSLPLSYSLSQNYPNPFNPVTKINYELPGDGKVKLMIYDILGREIRTLVNEVKQAGKYTVEFNGSNFASGVYFYRIEAGKFTEVKRMVLIK